MRKPLLAALIAATALAGCAGVRESRFNPFNWFGNSQSEPAPAPVEIPEETDPRPLVQQVQSITVEPTPGGAVVRAVGLPATQGFFEAELTPATTADPGTLTYLFRAIPPQQTNRVGTTASREIVVAVFVSDQQLEGINTIRVVGQSNSQVSRR